MTAKSASSISGASAPATKDLLFFSVIEACQEINKA
jgi:hypothetical protein